MLPRGSEPGARQSAGCTTPPAQPRPHPQHWAMGREQGGTKGCCTPQRLQCPMTGPRETPQPQGLRKGCVAHTFAFSAFAPLAQKLLCDLAPCKLSRHGNPNGLFPAARLCRAGSNGAVGMDFSRTLSQLRAQQRMWMCHGRSRGQGSAPSQTICALNSHRHEPAAWPLRLGLGFQNERLGN